MRAGLGRQAERFRTALFEVCLALSSGSLAGGTGTTNVWRSGPISGG